MASLKPKYEFGGPDFTWESLKSQTPWPQDGIWGFASWKVTGWLLAYYMLSLVLYAILPANKVLGTKLKQSGRPLEYRLNGAYIVSVPMSIQERMLIKLAAFSSTVVQLVACAIGTYFRGADFAVWTFISDNYLQLLTVSIILSYLISLYVYIASFSITLTNPDPTLRELAEGGRTGNIIYDFFIGRELNPRITLPIFGEIDLKIWLEVRPGLTGWILLDLAFVAKQYRTYGFLSDSILFIAAAQTYYNLEGQYFERNLLNMMDIKMDGLGYMLVFGDIAWVPFLYSTQCRYLSVHPVHLGTHGLVAVAAVFVLGLYIFRAANSQKSRFRTQADHRAVKDLPYIQTRRGTRLLTGGWWGMSRHMNYLGDWIQALPFSLPTALAGYLILPTGTTTLFDEPGLTINMLDGRVVVQRSAKGYGAVFTYFYVVYFAALLIHRERRDDRACEEKYGEDWEKYKKIVRWRILPGIY
ncbi:hypothetical protein PG996_006103 [Apiospora saccharicola]|uniref:Delta(14)-sterol reductase n=1 Tax=Apiospora saccharicola TaxID=335842 RepID=A0ABR1VRC5_9PEZI